VSSGTIVISEPSHWNDSLSRECWCMPRIVPASRDGDMVVHRLLEFETVDPAVFRHYCKKHMMIRGPYWEALTSPGIPIPWQDRTRRWGMLLGSRWIQAYF
jgi:hypothetical protein